MANAFLSGYNKRKYRGFVSNDAVKNNWAKLIVGYAGAGSDADGKVYNLDCRSDFNDYALVRFAASSNTRQKEWKEKHTADTSADKWFKPTESYSSVLTSNLSSGTAVVYVNDASGFANSDWIVITRDNGTDEFVQIFSVVGNAIYLEENVANDYTTADNAKVMLGYYIYYKDEDDTTDYQDGANTFSFFDHFLGSSLEAARWDTGGTGGTVAVSGSVVTVTATDTGKDKWISTDDTWTGGYAVRAMVASVGGTLASNYVWASFVTNQGSAAGTDFACPFRVASGDTYFTNYSADGVDGALDTTGNTIDADWHTVDCLRTGTATYFYLDGADYWSGTYPCNTARHFDLQDYRSAEGIKADWVLLRKYPDTVGSGFGAEEAADVDVTTSLLTTVIASLVPTFVLDVKPVASLLTATVAMLAPAMGIDRIFTTSLLTADAAILIPEVCIGVDIDATLLTTEIAMLVPVVTTIKNPNISMTLLTADAAMLTPALVLDRIFNVPLMAADIALLIPEIGIGVVIAVSLLTGDILMLIPSVSVGSKPFEGIAYNIKKIEGIGYNVKKIEGIGYNVKKIEGIKGG